MALPPLEGEIRLEDQASEVFERVSQKAQQTERELGRLSDRLNQVQQSVSEVGSKLESALSVPTTTQDIAGGAIRDSVAAVERAVSDAERASQSVAAEMENVARRVVEMTAGQVERALQIIYQERAEKVRALFKEIKSEGLTPPTLAELDEWSQGNLEFPEKLEGFANRYREIISQMEPEIEYLKMSMEAMRGLGDDYARKISLRPDIAEQLFPLGEIRERIDQVREEVTAGVQEISRSASLGMEGAVTLTTDQMERALMILREKRQQQINEIFEDMKQAGLEPPDDRQRLKWAQYFQAPTEEMQKFVDRYRAVVEYSEQMREALQGTLNHMLETGQKTTTTYLPAILEPQMLAEFGDLSGAGKLSDAAAALSEAESKARATVEKTISAIDNAAKQAGAQAEGAAKQVASNIEEAARRSGEQLEGAARRSGEQMTGRLIEAVDNVGEMTVPELQQSLENIERKRDDAIRQLMADMEASGRRFFDAKTMAKYLSGRFIPEEGDMKQFVERYRQIAQEARSEIEKITEEIERRRPVIRVSRERQDQSVFDVVAQNRPPLETLLTQLTEHSQFGEELARRYADAMLKNLEKTGDPKSVIGLTTLKFADTIRSVLGDVLPLSFDRMLAESDITTPQQMFETIYPFTSRYEKDQRKAQQEAARRRREEQREIEREQMEQIRRQETIARSANYLLGPFVPGQMSSYQIQWLSRMFQLSQRMLLGFTAVGAAVGTVYMGINQIIQGLEEMHRRERDIQELAETFGDAEGMIRRVQEALDDRVSEKLIIPVALAVDDSSPLANTELFATLAEKIQAQADRAGKEWPEMMALVVQAIEEGNTSLLEQEGIIEDADRALREYARSQGLFVTQLSEYERQQVLVNEAIRASNEAIRASNEAMRDLDATPMDELRGAMDRLTTSFGEMADAVRQHLVNLFGDGVVAAVIAITNAVDELRVRIENATTETENLRRQGEMVQQVSREQQRAFLQQLQADRVLLMMRLDPSSPFYGFGNMYVDNAEAEAAAQRQLEILDQFLAEAQRQIEETGDFSISLFSVDVFEAMSQESRRLANEVLNENRAMVEGTKSALDDMLAAWDDAIAQLEETRYFANLGIVGEDELNRVRALEQEKQLAYEIALAQQQVEQARERVRRAETGGTDTDREFARRLLEEAEYSRRVAEARMEVFQANRDVAEAQEALNAAIQAGNFSMAQALGMELQRREAILRTAQAQYNAVQVGRDAAAAVQEYDDALVRYQNTTQQAAEFTGLLYDEITGIPIAFDAAKMSAAALEEQFDRLNAQLETMGEQAARSAFQIASGLSESMGILGAMQAGSGFSRQQVALFDTFQQLNQQRVEQGRSPFGAEVLSVFQGELSRRQRAEVAEATRETTEAYDRMAERIKSTLDSLVNSVLQDTTRELKIPFDELLPREDEVDENARRMADVAVLGFKSPWFEGLRDEGLIPEDVIQQGEDAIRKFAAQMVRDHQAGLTNLLYDTERAADEVVERIQAREKRQELIDEVREKVKEKLGGDEGISDEELASMLGLETQAESIARGVKSALEGTFSFDEILSSLNELMTSTESPIVSMLQLPEDQQESVKNAGTNAMVLVGDAMAAQAETGKYGERVVEAVLGKIEEKKQDLVDRGAEMADWLGTSMLNTFAEKVPDELINIIVGAVLPSLLTQLGAQGSRTSGSGVE